ncbi:OsmC family protein [Tessaracoccus oleiagri]|uniref:Uncharacterized OsmC-related protein n=1 Tax=Tessaracoccus oleiagri TaxID=686624 RepID=A0A1G9HU24_9ACTN|nr:OsmC family protein [Tessaracoccus oleiagri]SDL16316.1 Uncharacterized OsmC-related protein [Tessaracoccus oleiagri]
MKQNPVGVSVTRTGARTFVGRTSTGAELRIGSGEGEFEPTELLLLALAGCAAKSAETQLDLKHGDGTPLAVTVSGQVGEDNAFHSLEEVMEIDLAAIDPARRDRMLEVLARVIHRLCTVERSLGAPIEVRRSFAQLGA